MMRAIDGLIRELRIVGIPISVSEHIDGLRALHHVCLEDRDAVKSALASVFVKSAEHESAYSVVFDIFFSLHRDRPAEGTDPAAGGGLSDLDAVRLRELLVSALQEDGQPSLLRRLIATELVNRHAGIQPGRAVAGTYYLFRTLRAVEPDRLVSELLDRDPAAGSEGTLLQRVRHDEARHKVNEFEKEIEAEIRRRLVADRGAHAVAKTLRHPLPEDVEFLTASVERLGELRTALTPMSRKMAARLAQRRRHRRRGTLDFRRTVRRSMSTGGTPLEPVFRRPRPAKPDLFVLADISGSVSTFAAFTLQLTYALRSEFSRVRSFVFVDGLHEVTSILAESDSIVAATQRINDEGCGIWLDGRSDYGNALEMFWQQFGTQLKSRTTVLVLGDARTNYHASRSTILGEMQRKAGSVYWLNPEPSTVWDSGDSVIGEYQKYCTGVFECRNLRQLRAFVEQLA